MRLARNHGRLVGACLLAAVLASAAGCYTYVHPLAPPEPLQVQACKDLPSCCRSHVYVFLLNGADPINKDNLSGLCDYLQDIGFPRTYFGQPYHVFWFRSEIRRIHQDDPDARFAVVGFSCGANMARSLVRSLAEDGIRIDLLVYLGGDTLKNEPKNQPENACRIVNIRAQGCVAFAGLWDGADLDRAENYYLCGVGHSELPTHCETIATLTRELIGLAATVPFIKPEEKPMPPALEEAPTPRPLTAQPAAERDEWDFLKPVSRLRMPENVQPTLESAPTVERTVAR